MKRLLSSRAIKQKGTPLLFFWFTHFIVVVVGTLIAFGIAGYQEYAYQDSEARRHLEWRMEALAQRLTQRFAVYQTLLQGLAVDPALARVLTEYNPQRVAEYETALTRTIPDALRVRLLRPGHDTADLQSDPPLSFASLDLLRAAKTSATPLPLEIHQAQYPKPHPVLVGVVLVRDQNGLERGLIHLALNAAALQKMLNEVSELPAWVGLQQQVAGKAVTLLSRSATGESPAHTDNTRTLIGSQLQLAYTYQSAANTDVDAYFILLNLLGILLGLYALILGAQYFWVRRVLLADQKLFIAFMTQRLAGKKLMLPTPTVREFRALLASLEPPPLSSESLDSTAPLLKGTTVSFPSLIKGLDVSAERDSSSIVVATESAAVVIASELFQIYEIRGRIGQNLTPAIAHALGQALGSEAQEKKHTTAIVARNTRKSSSSLSNAVIAGLNASGCHVVNIGAVPSPLWQFAIYQLGHGCAVRVGSTHPDAEFSGMTLFLDGNIVAGSGLLALRERCVQGRLQMGTGTTQTHEIVSEYFARVMSDISMARPLKIVLDCRSSENVQEVAPPLFRQLGCSVVVVETRDVPSAFDPSRAEHLQALQKAVVAQQADLGLAFSSDGDRLGVIDSQGQMVWPDRVLMLLAADVLSRNPGSDVVFDVQCSRALASQIIQNSGRPVMGAAGAVALQSKLRETGALLAGSWSGQILFQERWYGFEDAFYAGARLVEMLALDPRDSAEVFADFPEFIGTPELLLHVPEGEAPRLIERLRQHAGLLGEAKLVTLDGLRAEFADGWGLVRASHTLSALSFRFEADHEEGLARIEGLYRTLLTAALPDLTPPF